MMSTTNFVYEWRFHDIQSDEYYKLTDIIFGGNGGAKINKLLDWMGWNACKQGKVSDCGQPGDHQDDACLAVFKLTRSLFVALPGWHSSTR